MQDVAYSRSIHTMRIKMKPNQTFAAFWARFGDRPLKDRREYFSSLSRDAQESLIHNFFAEKWHEVLVHNIIDQRLDYIKQLYGLDLIEMRINALRSNKVFLVDKHIWDDVEDLLMEFQDYYDTDLIFGGLVVADWGTNKQFCKIRRKSPHG
jgi:hypothetical protein